MTKVLITGGAGFVGSHITDRLLERGDDVLVIDNFATAPARHAAGARPAAPGRGHDRRHGRSSTGCSTSSSPRSSSTPRRRTRIRRTGTRTSRTNAVGTANVVQASERAGVERLVYFQTALCYGLASARSSRSRSRTRSTRRTRATRSPRPRASSTCASASLDWVSFRLANVYGPRNLTGPLPTFYQRLTRGQAVLRDGHAPRLHLRRRPDRRRR